MWKFVLWVWIVISVTFTVIGVAGIPDALLTWNEWAKEHLPVIRFFAIVIGLTMFYLAVREPIGHLFASGRVDTYSSTAKTTVKSEYRELSESQKQIISDGLKAHRERSLRVHTWDSVRDGKAYGADFRDSIRKGKWTSYLEVLQQEDEEHKYGVWLVGSKHGADPDKPSTMDIVSDLFSSAGVRFKKDVNEEGFVHIVIGRKEA